MSDVLNHQFVSAAPEGLDATKVQTSNWNAGHKFSGGANGQVLVRDTADETYGAAWSSALPAHGHVIADVTGLQAALDEPGDPHTHPIADVVGLTAALDAKAATSHAHAIGDVTALQAALDSKTATGHGHDIADVTSLQASLDAKAASGHTHAIGDTTGLQTALDGKSATGHTHAEADVTGLVSDLAAKQATNAKNAANGYAGLDAGTKLAGSQQVYGTGAATACEGNDVRLSDARVPTSHIHPESEVTGLVADLAAKQATSEKNAASGYAGLDGSSKLAGAQQVYGTGANTACVGNDARLSDARTPTAHAATHASGAGDPLKLDDLAAPDDTVDLNVSTTKHGLMSKLPGGTTTFYRADGAFAAPPGGGGGSVYTAFEKNLGVARRSGTFDITGLSGLTADKVVSIVQTAAPIASKGNARDEAEMDLILATGYVLDAATIRALWFSADKSVVVGTYAFAYQVSG